MITQYPFLLFNYQVIGNTTNGNDIIAFVLSYCKSIFQLLDILSNSL